jgi:hypothetical protein
VPVRRGGNGPRRSRPGACVACAMWMFRHASGRFAGARRWPQEGPDADGWGPPGERRLAPGRCRVGPVVGASGTGVSLVPARSTPRQCLAARGTPRAGAPGAAVDGRGRREGVWRRLTYLGRRSSSK